MEIESVSHEKTGLFARERCWLKALLEKFNAKVVEVAKRTKKLGQDDPRRAIHSLKVGLALTFVSLLYYVRPLYDGFGVSAMLAVLTVVAVFEFTVGETLCKCLNKGFATFLGGALGVGAHHIASLAGETGEHILPGIFVFLLAAPATFSRFFPGIKTKYDYGTMIFILTFSLVAVSGYRVDNILELGQHRLSTIIIGWATCVIVSSFVFPAWAGEDLHNLIALNMEKLASFVEALGGEYFKIIEDGESVVVSKDDKSFLQGYKSVVNSKTSEESLANFARWEPGHGNFKFRHPWKQYLMIGDLIRQCAFRVEALNGYINSEIQVPPEFQRKIQESCTKMSSESGKALKALASAIKTMTLPSSSAQPYMADLNTVLKTALLENSDQLEIIPAATVALLLVEIVTYTDKIAESVHELASLAHFKIVDPTVAPEKPQLLNRGTVQLIYDTNSPHVSVTVCGPPPALIGDNPRSNAAALHQIKSQA